MKLWFVEDDPPARSATTSVEGAAQIHAEHRRGLGVRAGGPWARVKVAVQHFGNDMIGRAQDVVVSRLATSCIGCHRGNSTTQRRPDRVAPKRLPESSLNRPRGSE